MTTQGTFFNVDSPTRTHAGTCVRCGRTLWRVAETGALVSKITLSALCRRGRTHEVKP